MTKPLALVTGASSGIGFELARLCAEDGHDLVIAANEPDVEKAAEKLRKAGAAVDAVQTDLSTAQGVDELFEALAGRKIDTLCANAGLALGHAFLEQDWDDIRELIDLNVKSTVSLVHRAGKQMKAQGKGRILITSSIAAFIPGTFMTVYNGTKAFLESFAYGLHNELKETGISVTCLMPGPTDTEIFKRAGMEDTVADTDAIKADPARVAKAGYEAMKNGRAGIVPGLANKIQTAFAGILPEELLAEMHRHFAEPREGYRPH